MNTLDLIPQGSPILLTAPVIIYGISAKKGTHDVPLSEQCNRLLNSCRTNYYTGIITMPTVTRFWRILDRLGDGVTNLEEEPEAGILASRFKPPVQNSLPKRINGLLFGELEIAPIDQQTFEDAAELIKASGIPQIPIPIALDFAAAAKSSARQPVIALAGDPMWSIPPDCSVYCANDLPWQVASRPPESMGPMVCHGDLDAEYFRKKSEAKAPRKFLNPNRIIRRRKRRRKGQTEFTLS